MALVTGRIFKNGNSHGINYTQQDRKHFNVKPDDIIVKKYSEDGKTMTLIKMTQDEYEEAQMKSCLDAYELKHGDVLDALAKL